MKNEKIIKKIEENLRLGYQNLNVLKHKVFNDDERVESAAAELVDIINNLNRLDYKLHWSFIIGRDLISDYINDEISRYKKELRNLDNQDYYYLVEDGVRYEG